MGKSTSSSEGSSYVNPTNSPVVVRDAEGKDPWAYPCRWCENFLDGPGDTEQPQSVLHQHVDLDGGPC